MSQIQKKREQMVPRQPQERFVEPAACKPDQAQGGGDDGAGDEPVEPVFNNQYSISCGADEYVLPSPDDLTVGQLRRFVQEHRPNGMTLEPGMPCFVNGEHVGEEDKLKLKGNLRIEFTKKAGVKGSGSGGA